MRTSDRTTPPIHRALQAARKAAGFETAAAAAAHFGWTVGRYRSHESGARAISEEDIRRYAQSFRVTLASLRTPDWETVDRQLKRAREAADKPRLAIALRLRSARILRGLKSAIEASKAFGVGTPTYLKHENGENGINTKLLEFYAARLSISPEWLSFGGLPSGLGSQIDERMHQVLRDPERFVGMARTVDWDHDPGPQMGLDGGRPPGVASVPEYRWSHLAERGGDLSAATPSGVIQFPKTSDQPSRSDDLFSVLLDVPNRYAPPFTRLFVSRSLNAESDGEFLWMSGGYLEVVRGKTSEVVKAKNVVGRLVGKLFGPA